MSALEPALPGAALPTYLVVARLYAVAVPGTCSHTAECNLPVVVSAAAAATKLLAGHGMIDIAALTTGASRGWGSCSTSSFRL